MKIINEDSFSIFIPLDQLQNETASSFNFDVPRMGQFCLAKSVFWHDPTNLFQKYQSTNLNQAPLFLKPIYYAATANNVTKSEQLKQVFLTLFRVKLTPNLDDYVELLCHITLLVNMNKSPFSYGETLNDVFKVYEIIVDKCIEMSNIAAGDMSGDDTAIVQIIQIDMSVRNYLVGLLKGKKVIPCFGDKWLEIANITNTFNNSPPIIIDTNFELAEKFADKLNIVVTNPAAKSSEFYDMCCRSDTLSEKLAYFFYNCLQLNSFTSVLILDLENITENLREAPDVQNICRRMLPYVQCFLHFREELEPVYKQLSSEQFKISENLLKLKFYR